eukprot:gene1417-1890_t
MNRPSARPAIEAALRNPNLMAAAAALSENRLEDAEPLLRGHLRDAPTDVAAIRMMAQLAAQERLCKRPPKFGNCRSRRPNTRVAPSRPAKRRHGQGGAIE